MKNEIPCTGGCASYSDCRDIAMAVSEAKQPNVCYTGTTTELTVFTIPILNCYFNEVQFLAGPPSFTQPLTGSTFDGCSMVGADFTDDNSQLNGVQFKNTCDLTGANFTGMDLSSTTFDSSTIFNNTDFPATAFYAPPTGSTFDGCSFNNSDFSAMAFYVPLTGSTFDGCSMVGAEFKGDISQLNGVQFKNKSDLTNANFTGMDLTSTTFDSSTIFNNTNFTDCKLVITNFANSFGSNNSVFYENTTYKDYGKFKIAYNYNAYQLKTSQLINNQAYSNIAIKTDTTVVTTFSNITFNNCTFLPWDATSSSPPPITFQNTTFANCIIYTPNFFVRSLGYYIYDTCTFTESTIFKIQDESTRPCNNTYCPMSNIKFINTTGGILPYVSQELLCWLVAIDSNLVSDGYGLCSKGFRAGESYSSNQLPERPRMNFCTYIISSIILLLSRLRFFFLKKK